MKYKLERVTVKCPVCQHVQSFVCASYLPDYTMDCDNCGYPFFPQINEISVTSKDISTDMKIYPKNSKELRERINGKGLRTVHEGYVLNAGLKGLIKELFKK